MKLDANWVFLAVLRYVPAIAVVVIALIFIFSFRIGLITNEMERTNIEIAENIFSSGLTYDRAVFDPEKLDTLISDARATLGTADKEPNIEPDNIARHCRIGYKAEIEDLKDGRKWAFGYAPLDGKDAEEFMESRMTHDASIYVKGKDRGYEDAHPARLTLTLRETWLSRIGCMVEEAYEFRETRAITVPCIFESKDVIDAGGIITTTGRAQCLLEIKKAGAKQICISKPDKSVLGGRTPAECRYFPKDITIEDSFWVYEKGQENKILTVYPLSFVPPGLAETCEALERKDAQPAKEGENVVAVILCLK